MKALSHAFRALAAALGLLGFASQARAVPVQTNAPITGEITGITLTTAGNVWSGGTITVGGQVVILPANLLIDLPNDIQSLQQIFANAPPLCQANGESGLAKTDRCNSQAKGAQAVILANRTDSGNVIAGAVSITKASEVVSGNVTYLSYGDGYFRLNGDPASPANTGVMVRVNDPPVGTPPLGRHTVQQGLGCAAGNTANCSPDVRFKVDPDNYTFAYATGYPACIPVTANGLADPNCPDSNRPPIVPATTNNPPPTPPVAADSRHFAPIQLGDFVQATGSFETVGGVTFLSAWAVRDWVDLTTRTFDPATGQPDLTQPDYAFIEEVDMDAPGYPAGRVRGRVLSTATDHNAILDYFTLHYDPVTNTAHQRILYTTQFNRQQGPVIFNGPAPTGVFDSQIRMDFFPGAKSLNGEPCTALLGRTPKSVGVPVVPGVNVAAFCSGAASQTQQDFIDNFNLMVPNSREIMVRTRRDGLTSPALDIHGRPTQSGHYKLPVTLDYGAFDDINLGMLSFPFSFSGVPWLMDRRLSPNGCVGTCESTQQPLTPFPFEGFDPRQISPIFGNSVIAPAVLPIPDQMFKFMTPAGDLTGVMSWPPSNPPAFPILAVPPLSVFPPVADEDSASTRQGVPVIVNVLANDVPVFGALDPASVRIATPPQSGATQVNPDGTVTYTPAPGATGTVSFSYTVANTFGAVSLPGTVTVTIGTPPTAVNDAATVPAGGAVQIDIAANDVAGSSPIILSSVLIVSPLPAACGSIVNQLNGSVTLTAPAVVPQVPCSFGYTVQDLVGSISNIATVTVTVAAPSLPPVAVGDTATTAAGTPVAVAVLANDVAGLHPIDSASVTIATPPASGTALADATGTVTYTPAAGFSGTDSFGYTVRDSAGATSNLATVTVTVAPVAAPLAVTRAQFTLSGATWRVDGIQSPAPAAGSTVTIYNSPTVGAAPLASVAVQADGTWTWTSAVNAPQPDAQRQISVQSDQNAALKLEQVTVTVR